MIRGPLLLLALLLLQACSAVRLGYQNADSLTRWWMDQYLDFEPAQEALVRERLARLHGWHRRTQLPDYANVLRQAQGLAGGSPTADDVLALGDAVIARVRATAEQAIPDMADLLPTLTTAQIERMERRFAEKNEERAREEGLVDGETGQRKARYKRTLERAEYWLDSFGGAQKAALRQLIDGQTAGSQFWHEERQRRQREWLELVRKVVREKPPRERIVQSLREYLVDFDLPRDPARLAQARALRRASAELAVAILGLATPAQREHARHKLGDFIADIMELQQQSDPSPPRS